MRSRGFALFRSWVCPILLAVVALAVDAAYRRLPFTLLGSGMLDEVAHLATAALGLLVLERLIGAPRGFYVAALISSVAIDLDHVPLYLGLLGNESQRPVTHSLATVAVFVCAAVALHRHRAVLAGVATGLVLHFARDMAESSQGVRLFWPFQQTSWTLSYWCYLGMIIAFMAVRPILITFGMPRTRIQIFRTSPPTCRDFPVPIGSVTAGNQVSNADPDESELESTSEPRLS